MGSTRFARRAGFTAAIPAPWNSASGNMTRESVPGENRPALPPRGRQPRGGGAIDQGSLISTVAGWPAARVKAFSTRLPPISTVAV